MRLFRSHGLGNDYLVCEDGPALTPALVRALCDRHTGVGGDGVLEPADPGPADHGVRIWNPDGSVAEKSGNGLRIYARWLADRGHALEHTLWTGSELVRCRVDGLSVTVDMGRARFGAAEVPVDRPRLDDPLDVDGQALRVTAVGVGNPHCVVFADRELDRLPWRRWGRALEVHPAFPNRTNVQVAVVVDGRLHIRIWERGAGETSASGSSSCAAAAAVRLGHLPPGPVTVVMPGGTLRVDVGPDLDLVLTGAVEPVGRVEVDARWLEAR